MFSFPLPVRPLELASLSPVTSYRSCGWNVIWSDGVWHLRGDLTEHHAIERDEIYRGDREKKEREMLHLICQPS